MKEILGAAQPCEGPTAEVLIVDDSHADVRLVEEAFGEARSSTRFNVAYDGEEALAYLKRSGRHAEAPRPDLILLDLNMPRLDGYEVLKRIKADESLKDIPVIIFSNSAADQDIRKAYELNANCYIRKPAEFSGMIDVVRALETCWLDGRLCSVA